MKRTALLIILAAGLSSAALATDWQDVEPKSNEELAKIFDRPVTGIESVAQSDALVVSNALTPALAYRTKTGKLRLFAGMDDYGLEAPTHVAWVDGGQVKTAGRGKVDSLDESWLLVWFGGSKTFRNLQYTDYAKQQLEYYKLKKGPVAFDVPMLVSLQRKPASVTLDEQGLTMEFEEDSGVVQVMPLTGAARPDPDVTAGWAKSLPEEVAQRCRDWNARLKFYPAQCVESYEVDAEAGLIKIIYDYRFVELDDAWRTEGRKAAPVPPAVALAAKYGMELEFSGETLDTGCPSQYGPTWVVPGEASLTVTVPKLMDLIAKVRVPDVDRSADTDLLKEIDNAARGKAADTGMGWWAAASCAQTQGNKAALLPYCSEETSLIVKAATMRLMHNQVFNGTRTVERLIDEDRGRVYLVDYINHYQRYAGDNEAPSSEILRGAFKYAFYTGDWNTIETHWTMLQQAAVASYVKNNWTIQGRFNSGGDTFHDVIVGTAAMARMAGALGKEEDFGLFSYLFARHMICYHGFEYSLKLHALEHQPWFIPVKDENVIIWDIYKPFGAKFAPLTASGFYGANTGFYEHYFRVDEDILPRYYHAVLPEHTQKWFGEKALKLLPDPEPKERDKWMFLFDMRAYFLQHDYKELKKWLDSKNNWKKGKNDVEVYVALYDAKHPRKLVNVVKPSLRKPLKGLGVHLQSNGFRHHAMDMETRTRREPGMWWWGWHGDNAKVTPEMHSGHIMMFGHMQVADGKVVGRVTDQPNWVAETYSFNISTPTPEQQAAAQQQANAKWAICGPFGDARKDGKDFNEVFAPEEEKRPNFRTTYPSAGVKKEKDKDEPTKVTAKWELREMNTRDNGKDLGPYTLSCRWGFNHFGHTYLYTRVWAPEAMDVRCGISSHGRHRVWINGEKVHEIDRDPRDLKPDAYVFEGELKEGWNDVLVKIRNVEFWEKFYFRIYDENEQPIPGLKFNPNG
jgi:hypothetical protein